MHKKAIIIWKDLYKVDGSKFQWIHTRLRYASKAFGIKSIYTRSTNDINNSIGIIFGLTIPRPLQINILSIVRLSYCPTCQLYCDDATTVENPHKTNMIIFFKKRHKFVRYSFYFLLIWFYCFMTQFAIFFYHQQ